MLHSPVWPSGLAKFSVMRSKKQSFRGRRLCLCFSYLRDFNDLPDPIFPLVLCIYTQIFLRVRDTTLIPGKQTNKQLTPYPARCLWVWVCVLAAYALRCLWFKGFRWQEEKEKTRVLYQVFLEMPTHLSIIYIAQVNEKMNHFQDCVGTVTL